MLGVFSYRSFSEKMLARSKKVVAQNANSTPAQWIGDLPVEDFLECYEFVPASQDWKHILRYLNQDDAFFVSHPDELEGLVTTMDVLAYFRQIASSFIILAEIELSLRKINVTNGESTAG